MAASFALLLLLIVFLESNVIARFLRRLWHGSAFSNMAMRSLFESGPRHVYRSRRLDIPRPLHACKPRAGYQTPFAETEESLMSMYVSGSAGAADYRQGACKLLRSARHAVAMDATLLVMPSRAGDAISDDAAILELEGCGWRICAVDTLDPAELGTLASPNRFLVNHLYTKLRAWEFDEYQAVLFLDTDAFVVGPLAELFTVHAPLMRAEGRTVAMARRDEDQEFNAGIILLLPNRTEFARLADGVDNIPHSRQWAEQNLLTVVYDQRSGWYTHRDGTVVRAARVLPFRYNAIVTERSRLERDWWALNISIIHFTTKPWNPMHCWKDDVEDICLLWYLAFH